MALGTLLLSGAMHYLMAAVFLYVGLQLRRRETGVDARGPMLALAAWWLALGLSTTLTATSDVLGALGFTPMAVFATISDLNALVVVAGLAGLIYYLSYLFTGRHVQVVVALFFALVLALVLYNNNARVPIGVDIQAWDTDIAWAQPDAGVPRALLFLVLLLPPMVGAGGLLALYPRMPGPTQRFRVALVAGSILIWFGGVLLLGVFANLDAHPAFGLIARLLGVGAAAAAYLAYFPPAWARHRFGVEAVPRLVALPRLPR